MRGRGGGLNTGGAEAAEAAYETALSQQVEVTGFPGIWPGGEASPNTLEQGLVQGVTASPFHSERVQTEVELLRRRPLTLDEDAQRVATTFDESGLGDPGLDLSSREPPYNRESSNLEGFARVARLEGRPEEAQQPEMELRRVAPSEDSNTGEVRTQPSVQQPDTGNQTGATMVSSQGQALPVEARSTAGHGRTDSERREQLSDQGIGASGVPVRPLPEDTRELIPAFAPNQQLEALLLRALEENRVLKGRLEQFETPSWYSGRSPMTPQNAGVVHESPASLMHPSVGPEAAYVGANPVHMTSSLVHARAHEGMVAGIPTGVLGLGDFSACGGHSSGIDSIQGRGSGAVPKVSPLWGFGTVVPEARVVPPIAPSISPPPYPRAIPPTGVVSSGVGFCTGPGISVSGWGC